MRRRWSQQQKHNQYIQKQKRLQSHHVDDGCYDWIIDSPDTSDDKEDKR